MRTSETELEGVKILSQQYLEFPGDTFSKSSMFQNIVNPNSIKTSFKTTCHYLERIH